MKDRHLIKAYDFRPEHRYRCSGRVHRLLKDGDGIFDWIDSAIFLQMKNQWKLSSQLLVAIGISINLYWGSEWKRLPRMLKYLVAEWAWRVSITAYWCETWGSRAETREHITLPEPPAPMSSWQLNRFRHLLHGEYGLEDKLHSRLYVHIIPVKGRAKLFPPRLKRTVGFWRERECFDLPFRLAVNLDLPFSAPSIEKILKRSHNDRRKRSPLNLYLSNLYRGSSTKQINLLASIGAIKYEQPC